MILPSKELLSEVLGYKINDYALKDKNIKINKITVSHLESEPKIIGYEKVINVYHLAHKCKEWLIDLTDNDIQGTQNKDVCIVTIYIKKEADFHLEYADTEIEAIFLACEWLLKEMKK